MDQDTYMEERVDDQINWYDGKSQWNQNWYKRIRIFEICAAASIPFLVGYIDSADSAFKIAIGVLGVLIAVIAGILGLYQFQERWVEYRTASESLKREKLLFLATAEPYNITNPFPLFVQRVESLTSSENIKWAQNTGASEGSQKKTGG